MKFLLLLLFASALVSFTQADTLDVIKQAAQSTVLTIWKAVLIIKNRLREAMMDDPVDKKTGKSVPMEMKDQKKKHPPGSAETQHSAKTSPKHDHDDDKVSTKHKVEKTLEDAYEYANEAAHHAGEKLHDIKERLDTPGEKLHDAKEYVKDKLEDARDTIKHKLDKSKAGDEL